jgi:hypothetical protein
MPDSLVTIATFTYPNELFVIKGRFDAEGIEYFTADENTIAVNPFLSNAIGGIKLNVREGDVNRALEILKEIEKNNLEEIFQGSDDEDETAFKKESEAANKNLSRGCMISIILFGLAVIAGIFYSIFFNK